MEEEIWKDVVGYEGVCKVSNLGRVKSLDVEVECKNSHTRVSKGIVRATPIDKDGYLKVCINTKGKSITKTVHRIVLEAFVPNINNKPQVNHINGIKHDNRIENLEWSTRSENMKHAYKNGLLKPYTQRIGAIHPHNKQVIQYDLNGNYICEFNSIKEASISCGANRSHISAVCLNKRKTAFKYKWKYK